MIENLLEYSRIAGIWLTLWHQVTPKVYLADEYGQFPIFQ